MFNIHCARFDSFSADFGVKWTHLLVCKWHYRYSAFDFIVCLHPALVLHLFLFPFAFTPLDNLQHFNLHPLIFILTPVDWLHSLMLTPYFWWEYQSWFIPFWFAPTFSECNQGVNQGLVINILTKFSTVICGHTCGVPTPVVPSSLGERHQAWSDKWIYVLH